MAEPIISGIYAIRNLHTGTAYIGSAVRIVFRWRQHKVALRRGTHHSRYLQRAWNKYGERGFGFSIIEAVEDPSMLVEREQHWIDAHKASGLYNVCHIAGSTLGKKHSDQTKAKMRAINSTPEARAANTARQLGRKPSQETFEKHRATLDTSECRERLSMAHRGHKASVEAREKNRLSHLGLKRSDATKAKLRANGLGRRHSADTKTKISMNKTGKKLGPQSPEHIQKRAAKRVGTHMSENTKAKIGFKARMRGPISDAHKAKIAAFQKGRVKTREHIAKIEASKRLNRRFARVLVDPRQLSLL